MSKMDENDFVETGNWQLCAKWGQRALPDERAEAVRQLLEKEQTVEQIVSRFNLSSVQVVYGWIGRYIEESLLSDTSQKPEVDSKELTLSEALKEIKGLKTGLSEPLLAHGLIHHSDRGCQYCCYEYVAVLKSRGVRISMTESGDPLENAVAERVNGLIKSEWLNNVEIKDLADCLCRVEKAINAYNNVRPHLSLNYQTPAQAHRQSGSQKRCWKTWSERRNERLLQISHNAHGAEVKAIVDDSTTGSDENALRH